MRLLAFFYLLFFPFVVSAAAKPKVVEKPNTVLEELQRAWDKTQTYQAEFKQTVKARHLDGEETTSGTLSILKPDRIRWEDTGSGTLQILNGGKLYVIQPNKRRKTRSVDIYSNAAKAVDSPALGFLSGKSKFSERYKVKTLKETPDIAELNFTPKDGSRETLIAEIDKHGYVLRSLTTNSADSRIRVDFANEKLNTGLDKELFEYKKQDGDVVHPQ